MEKIKQKLVIEKSHYDEDYIVFLHNQTKYGDCWRRLFKGKRKDCYEKRKQLLNEENF